MGDPPGRYVDYVRLNDVQTAARNPQGHDTAGIHRSISHFGFAELPLVDDRTGRLVAGHGRLVQLQEMHAAGKELPDGVRVDDDGAWLMPVVRGWASRSDDDAEAYVIASNRLTEKGGHDDRVLTEMLGDLAESQLLELTGYDAGDLDDLVKALADGGGTGGGGGEHDDAPIDPPPDPITRPGDVWQLGQHRLICGDSFDRTVLDELLQGEQPDMVLADPPYGINLDTDYSKLPPDHRRGRVGVKYRPVGGDDKPFDASPLRAYFTNVDEQFWFGADYYHRTLTDADAAAHGSWLVWDKRSEAAEEIIGSSFELIWSAVRHKRYVLRHFWCSTFGGPESRNRLHPTQNPTTLLGDIMNRWSKSGGLIVDPFGGSGSTLISAERAGRSSRLVERDVAYCDVTCRRFQECTGITPVRRGEPYDFTPISDQAGS